MFKISLCMIVKNEELTLSRCLDCAKQFVDEIIIVDTGSTDKTKLIAQNYTNKIFDFEWSYDFSKARNFAFSKATCNYIMWLDADDIITDENILKILNLKNSNKNADVFMLKYAISFDENNQPTFVYYRERILKKERNFRWEGFIHEVISPQGKIEYEDIIISHNKIHRHNPKRNLKIYHQHIKNGETLNARELFYYGRELFYNQYFKKCIDTMKLFLKQDNLFIPNVIDSYKIIALCYLRLNKSNIALKFLLDKLRFYPPNAEICCLIASICLKINIPLAIFWYNSALICEKDEKSGAFIEPDYYDFIPHLQLCCLYYQIGNYEKAKYFHNITKKEKPDDSRVIYNEKFFN